MSLLASHLKVFLGSGFCAWVYIEGRGIGEKEVKGRKKETLRAVDGRTKIRKT